ncbi:MAG: molecular chaperone DjlA [Rhodobiaceae bacterium]|jgi:DnaJ like chaperone protein|nr:molecular chaperone DjlA [Rhodobiaceae bacterium]
MSTWGKLAGASAGYLIGGIIGAVVGAVAGHYVIDNDDEDVAFAIALIALSAKMSTADGKMSEKELLAFKDILSEVPDNELKNVFKIYNLAREDTAGYEAYAQQISVIFKDNTEVLENVLDGLFHIAKSDNPVNKKEVLFLERVAGIFGFTSAEFSRIRASHMGSEIDDPWLVLGLDSGTNINIAQKAWKELVAQNHPDRLIAKGVPKELLGMANEKLAIINSAYDRIVKAHKMKAGTEI